MFLDITRDEITGEPVVDDSAEPETVVFAAFEYPFRGQPATLSIAPPRVPDVRPASIGFVAYHRGLPINDSRSAGSAALPSASIVS